MLAGTHRYDSDEPLKQRFEMSRYRFNDGSVVLSYRNAPENPTVILSFLGGLTCQLDALRDYFRN